MRLDKTPRSLRRRCSDRLQVLAKRSAINDIDQLRAKVLTRGKLARQIAACPARASSSGEPEAASRDGSEQTAQLGRESVLFEPVSCDGAGSKFGAASETERESSERDRRDQQPPYARKREERLSYAAERAPKSATGSPLAAVEGKSGLPGVRGEGQK